MSRSVFSIGGMGRLLPFEPVMFCEWDEFPRSVLERRIKSGDLPDVPIHEDVRTLDPPDRHTDWRVPLSGYQHSWAEKGTER